MSDGRRPRAIECERPAQERSREAVRQRDAQQHEIERRARLRWWLALPWRRAMSALRRQTRFRSRA